MLKIGPTKGCKGCDSDSSAHNAERIARYQKAFGAPPSTPAVEPPTCEKRRKFQVTSWKMRIMSMNRQVSQRPKRMKFLNDLRPLTMKMLKLKIVFTLA